MVSNAQVLDLYQYDISVSAFFNSFQMTNCISLISIYGLRPWLVKHWVGPVVFFNIT